jgi:hypothetical protein
MSAPTPDPIEDLDAGLERLAGEAINVARRKQQLDDELAQLAGRVGEGGRRRGGRLANLRSKRSDAIGQAARGGDPPDLAAIEREIVEVEARIAAIPDEYAACKRVETQVEGERLTLLRAHATGLLERAQQMADEGEALRSTASAAAAAVLEARRRVGAALDLVSKSVSQGEYDKIRRGFRPWAVPRRGEASPADRAAAAAEWEAVMAVARLAPTARIGASYDDVPGDAIEAEV